MRRLYATRRDALVSALRAVFGHRIALDVPPGGMHVIARFPKRDVGLAERAQRGGLTLLSSCVVGRSPEFGLLLSFTNLPVEAAMREAQRLHGLLFG
jgi:GntR family transcriptional regulator / MocR family aminotransferase